MYRGDYQLIGSQMSFFTRKLEAQLRCQQIPWRYLFKTEERKAESGKRKSVCQVNGVGPDQAAAVQADFRNMLDALAVHFANNDFLLGERPCLADFALAGASKAHFVGDPEPNSWLGEHSDMLHEYTRRFFGEWQGELAPWRADDQVPNSLKTVLDYLQGSYYQSAPANVAAGLAGEKYYDYDCGFGTTRARTQKRLNLAGLHLQDELQRLGTRENDDIQNLFAGRGILEHYLA